MSALAGALTRRTRSLEPSSGERDGERHRNLQILTRQTTIAQERVNFERKISLNQGRDTYTTTSPRDRMNRKTNPHGPTEGREGGQQTGRPWGQTASCCVCIARVWGSDRHTATEGKGCVGFTPPSASASVLASSLASVLGLARFPFPRSECRGRDRGRR